MCTELNQVEEFLQKYDMKLGKNKRMSRGLLKKLNRKSIIARSMRCVYNLDDFIIKSSTDATGSSLPVGADQCLNEYDIYTSTDERVKKFRKILCPVYAIYESKFLYLTVHKKLTPLETGTTSDDTIYDIIKKGRSFTNEKEFFQILDEFKDTLVTKAPQLQNEYVKSNSFGYDENNNLYILDYGML